MNIMIFADQESKLLYEYYDPEQMKDIDLIISCGDLEPEYLTFFATLCHAPLLYVKGNHDTKYEYKPPEGCICIDDDIFVYKGVRILGLGGSMEYIPDSPNQYTEKMMRKRIHKLWWKLWRHKGFDILVTHAPAYKLLAKRRGKTRLLRPGITKAERAEYKELLKILNLGLEDRLTSKVGLLSGGQRQALTLLMATLQKAKLLLLDEHTAYFFS